MEGLNALVFAGQEEALSQQWEWVRDRQWDSERGGFHARLDEEGRVRDSRKGHQWKAAYHDTRALLNVMNRPL